MGLPGDNWRDLLCFSSLYKIRINPMSFMKGIATVSVPLLLLGSIDVYAEVTPRLEVNVYSNDNVALAPSGMEQRDIIYEVKPGFRAHHDGRYVDALLDYDVQLLRFQGDVDDSDTNHHVFLNTNTAFVPGTFFMDADATYTQQFVTSDSAIELDSSSLPGNLSDVSTVRLSPYVRQLYGSFASAEYRVGISRLNYIGGTDPNESDSTTRSASVNLQSGPQFNSLSWNLGATRQDINPDSAPNSTLSRASMSFTKQAGPRFSIIGTLGYEDNKYEQSNLVGDTSGSIWELGVGWNPSRFTDVEYRYGERYFGSTHTFNLKHRSHYTEWRMQYFQDVTTTSTLQLDYQNALPGDNVLYPAYSRRVEVIILDHASVSATVHTGKSQLSLNLYDDKRDYQFDDTNDDIRGAQFSWRWQFIPRTAAILSTEYYRQEFRREDRVDNLMDRTLRLERQIRRHVTGMISYGVRDRQSNQLSSEYLRHLASVGLKMEFH